MAEAASFSASSDGIVLSSDESIEYEDNLDTDSINIDSIDVYNALSSEQAPLNPILEYSILDPESEPEIMVHAKSKKRFASAKKELPPILRPIWKGDEVN